MRTCICVESARLMSGNSDWYCQLKICDINSGGWLHGQLSLDVRWYFPTDFCAMTSCFTKVGNLAVLLNLVLLVTQLILGLLAPVGIFAYWPPMYPSTQVTACSLPFLENFRG